MTGLTPQLFGILVACSGVAFLMMLAGVQKHRLEWRRRERRCPSCGLRIEARVCRRCTGY